MCRNKVYVTADPDVCSHVGCYGDIKKSLKQTKMFYKNNTKFKGCLQNLFFMIKR